MKTAKFLSLLFVASSFVSQSESPHTLIAVPKAKYLFSLSAAPLGPTLFLVASPDENSEDGENTGTPVLVQLGKSGRPLIKTLPPWQLWDGGSPPVWSRDGKIVYFETEKGIFSYGVADDRMERIWSLTARGLALSQDGRYLAFWDWSEQNRRRFNLIIFDLRNRKKKQTWVIPNNYGADEDWFDLAFAPDNNSIYANTFDEESQVPLKRFTIGAVNPEVVAQNITSVVAGQKSVYFVTERLDKQTLIYTLMAVSNGLSKPEQVKTDLPCRGLTVSGSLRWLVCKENLTGKPILLFDSATRTSTPFNPQSDNVVVMSNGEVVYSMKGSLLDGNNLR
jgi:hypothetical protein